MDLLQTRPQVAGHSLQTETRRSPEDYSQLHQTSQVAAPVPGPHQYPYHYGYSRYQTPQYGGVTTALHHMDMYRYSTTPAQPGVRPASGYSPAVSSYMYPQWSYPSQQYLYPGTSVPSSPHMMYNTPVHSTPKWTSQVTRGQGSKFSQDILNTPSVSRDSGIHSFSSLLPEGSSSASPAKQSKDLRKELACPGSPDCTSKDKDNTLATALSLSGISKDDLLPLSPFSFIEDDVLPPLSPTAIINLTPLKPPATTEPKQITKSVLNSKPQKQTRTKSRCKPKFLSKEAVSIMDSWFSQHLTHPYPSQEEKEDMAQRGGITVNQVNSWFNNRRNRSFNTGPKRQKRKLEEQLVSLCQNLTASNSGAAPGVIIHEISSLIQQNLQPSKRARLH